MFCLLHAHVGQSKMFLPNEWTGKLLIEYMQTVSESLRTSIKILKRKMPFQQFHACFRKFQTSSSCAAKRGATYGTRQAYSS